MEGLRERLLSLARSKGLTQLDLEQAAGVSHSTYNGMWERGTVTLERMERIAERLGMTLLDVLGGEAKGDTVSEPAGAYSPRPRYIEERVERLEVELRKLKEQLRNR